MSRKLTIRNLYDQVFNYMPFTGIWKDVLGKQTRNGIWLIYGLEKNGKSSIALTLAGYLSRLEKVLYVSGEEGKGDTFVYACQRAGIEYTNKNLHVLDYISIDELDGILSARKAERIVFIDNMTIYKKEITEDVIVRFINTYKDTLFVIIAHEKDNEPYPGASSLCSRLAKIIFHVKGLAVSISGRNGAGGKLVIDEEKAAIFHGDEVNK